ncbi:hypothetical protein GCM10009129_14150 [Psychrobacter aestuarii]|uniref:DUF721 domain-containing protein n=2 Tax=Psychrobacter aestuarii TaxID=556327 RepID=A0ABN0VUQ8_9GAMM
MNRIFITTGMTLTMSKKQPNRLAQLIEHQAFAGSALPATLTNDMHRFVTATAEIKRLLAECLPDEILSTCWVVGLTDTELTLSVCSVTAANHIRYLQKAYLELLTNQSLTFRQLKELRVVVVDNCASKVAQSSQTHRPDVSENPYKANVNQALSQNTKRTIAQAAEHVTTDQKLKNALLRLVND